ncbi:MAG TPA: hypothetical protein VLG12_04080 [Candidatus Saccharimonadales bacterium]|nr:hypothetical protein [Candidatus Saccharimonadales bacterium]
MKNARGKIIYQGLLSFFIFFALAIYITYPLIFHMGEWRTAQGDELVIAWIQNWAIHGLTSENIFSLFDANLYYPFHNSFAYSDIFITSSFFSLIPLLLVKQPIIVINFTLISALIFLGFSIYVLCFYLTKSFGASLLGGLLVVCSPAMLDKIGKLQILAIAWVPFSMLFFLIWIKKQKTRYLAVSLVCFVLQTYNSFVPGYFIVFSYVIILAYFFILNKKQIMALITWKNVFLFLVSFVLLIPIAIPYFQVSSEFHYVRDIRETIHFALQPEDLLYPGNTTRLHDMVLRIPFITQKSSIGEVKPGYLGCIFTVLAVFALWFRAKYFKKNNVYLNLFCIIALIGLVLSFGPALHINRHTIHWPFLIPLPYGILYYLVPGFRGIRDSERWEMLFILCIAIAISLVMQQVLKRVSLSKRIIIYLLLFLGIIGEFNFPMHLEKVPQVNQFPKVYAWLATTPKDTKIIIMPIYNWNKFQYTGQEMWREYYSTIEFRKMVNGYSGFSPPPWQTLVEDQYKNFPENNTIATLKNLGINYIIVDKDAYNLLYKDKQKNSTGEEIIAILRKNTAVKFFRKFGEDYVFRF